MEHLRWIADSESIAGLRHPVIIAAFTGWNDAGDAASTAVRTMIETTGARAVAEVDPEPFTDFATVRPQVRLDAERRRRIIWPTVGIWSASLPGTDVLFVLGPEPALRWRGFCEQLVGLAQRCESPLMLTLGALLADVPHTRPVHLIGTATDPDLIDRYDLEPSRYEGPTGIVGVLQHALTEVGIPAASLWAAVPGYASQIPSPKAAVALIERTCELIGSPMPISALNVEAEAYDARLATLVEQDEDLELYVARLEAIIDDADIDDDDITGEFQRPGVSPDDFELVEDPDVLVQEVEQFLRDRDSDH